MNDQDKNPFKQMLPEKEVPVEVKEKVMKNVTLLQLFGEITDLFINKMGNTLKELMNTNKGINHK